MAAADELVGLTLPEFASLGVVAMLTEARERGGACAIALSHRAAGVLRLVDRALAAHGRDNGYHTAPGLNTPSTTPTSGPTPRRTSSRTNFPITMLVEAAAQALADAVIAFPRDRFGVPEALIDAVGSLMNLYALAHRDRDAAMTQHRAIASRAAEHPQPAWREARSEPSFAVRGRGYGRSEPAMTERRRPAPSTPIAPQSMPGY